MGSFLSRSHSSQPALEENEMLVIMVPGDEEAAREDCASRMKGACGIIKTIKSQPKVMILQIVVGACLRFADNFLDVRAGLNFLSQGDHWWAFFTLLFVIICPVVQCLYMSWKHGIQVAWPYSVPFGAKHLLLEVRYARFLNRLPESAFSADLPACLSAGTLNKALAGIECGFESLPQAVIQSRAFYVKGGDWLNLLSIVSSLAGVTYGVYLGASALLNRRAVYKDFGGVEVFPDLDFSRGKAAAFVDKDLTDQSTQEALLWMLSQDELISQVDLSKAICTDMFVPKMAQCMPQLQQVLLPRATAVTDEAITELAHNCKSMSMLDLSNTAVTDEAIKQLCMSMPSCHIAS